VGVSIEAGQLRVGTPLCVTDKDVRVKSSFNLYTRLLTCL